MAYYSGMGRSNYAAGDYYGARYGDPGILGSIAKAVGGFAKGFVTGGPLGAVTGAAGALFKRPTGTSLVPVLPPPPVLQIPTSQTQIGPGGVVYKRTEFGGRVTGVGGGGGTGRRGRRMNVANARALRRALRRVAGFGKLAARARREIGKAASAVGARRVGSSGSRGVITRSEAARALRR